jgi:RimJ/RimL family protein N-acetyltransferase
MAEWSAIMTTDIWTGKSVRLALVDPETDAPLFSHWRKDSEYSRLLDTSPVGQFPAQLDKEWVEKENLDRYLFLIRTLEDDRVIGFIELDGIDWRIGNGWIGIGIGDREQWGKGYGTDAFRVLIRYAFRELNLRRLTLTVFEYNLRAIRSYEKLGFQVEGRDREWLRRDGRRWDMIHMGLMRRDWEASELSG